MAVSLKIDGTEHPLQSGVAVREAIGEHFRATAVILTADLKPADLVGKAFSLVVKPKAGDPLTLAGIVTSAGSVWDHGAQVIELELGPEGVLLTQGRGSYVYLKQTAAEIGAAVLKRAGLPAATWSATATPPKRPYTVQYREDDWTFIDRVTREDGLYSFYDHEDGTKLVFTDDSTKAKAIDGTFVHRTHHGTTTTEKTVSALAARAVVTTNAFATRDRDPAKPKLALAGKATADDGKLEIYAWPARVSADVGDAAARAKTALESLRAQRLVVSGDTESLALRCGRIFEVAESTDDNKTPWPADLRKLFCIALEWTAQGDQIQVHFTAVPSTVPFRLPLLEPRKAALGSETAFVRGAQGQEIDADDTGRVFVQPPWDRGDKKDDTCTIRSRVGQAALARSMAIPRIGWGMLVGHHDGDVDRPWVMARLVDGTHPPAYKLPDEMTKTSWQTLTSTNDGTLSEIVFEDKKDNEQIIVNAARDMTVAIGDNEARTIGNRHVLEVTKDRTVTIDADEKLTVTKDQTTSVKGAETTTIEGSRSITVKGKEEDSVGGTRTETAKADRTSDVGKKRTLTVGGTMDVKTKKGFTREVLKAFTASSGGAWALETDGGLVVTTKADTSETVTGSHTSNGKAGIQTLVKGDLTESIAAAHAVTAKGSVGESAKGKMTLTVAAALTGTAPTIEISADTEITIAAGGSTITIKSSEVSVKAALLSVAGPVVVIDGATVKHNP